MRFLASILLALLACSAAASAKQLQTPRQFAGQNFGQNNGLGNGIGYGPGIGLGPGSGPQPGFGQQGIGQNCPLCDSSVYTYCSHKVIHDACCCDFTAAPQLRPPQCAYYDCSLLYAKSCYEHALIKNCCCNSPY